jgi:hypothetical protein
VADELENKVPATRPDEHFVTRKHRSVLSITVDEFLYPRGVMAKHRDLVDNFADRQARTCLSSIKPKRASD